MSVFGVHYNATFLIRISGTHPSPLKTAGNDKTIYLVALSRASHRKHLKMYWKHSKMIEIKQVTRLTSERARVWMAGRVRKRTLSDIPASQIHRGSIVQIEPTISDAARWQEILSTRAVAQKGNSTANKLVVSRSVYPRRVLYIFAPGWPIKHPADYTDADFRQLIQRRDVEWKPGYECLTMHLYFWAHLGTAVLNPFRATSRALMINIHNI